MPMYGGISIGLERRLLDGQQHQKGDEHAAQQGQDEGESDGQPWRQALHEQSPWHGNHRDDKEHQECRNGVECRSEEQ
jgi:hypothetical protein